MNMILSTPLPPNEQKNKHHLVNQLEYILLEHKAEHVVRYDVQSMVSYTDDMIIATAISNRHILALTEYVNKELKKNKIYAHIMGSQHQSDWVILDAGFCVIHLFSEEARLYYDLDSLYSLDTISPSIKDHSIHDHPIKDHPIHDQNLQNM